MHIDQRHVTTVDLHDGKVRSFNVRKDDRGCKLTGVSRDDVFHLLLSPRDYQRMQHELCRLSLSESHHARRDVAESEEPAIGNVRIDQRQVTTVSLQSGKVHDFLVRKDDRGYRLNFIAKDEVVHLLITPHDLLVIRDAMKPNLEDEDLSDPTEEKESTPTGYETSVYRRNTIDWLAFN